MIIEAGKFYKTRAGDKVGPMRGSNFKWIDGRGTPADPDWTNTGRAGRNTTDDLVAEWVDEARRMPKVGDTVRVLECAVGHARHFRGMVVKITRVDEFCDHEGATLFFKNEIQGGRESCLVAGEWAFDSERIDPDRVSTVGDFVEVVSNRYPTVAVGSVGTVTGRAPNGRHVVFPDGRSFVFALDEIARTDKQPAIPAKVPARTLRDDIAIAALAAIVGKLPVSSTTATPNRAGLVAVGAYAYADAMLAERVRS